MENKLRKFKLIDEDGYLNSPSFPKITAFEDLCLKGFIDTRGDLSITTDMKHTLLVKGDLRFFEEILPEQTFWKENTPLEKSLIVGKKCQGEKAFQIEHVGKEIVLLKEVTSGKESCTTKDNLKSLLPDEDEILFQKVLSKWKNLTLDNAYDHRGSAVNLERFYLVVKSIFDEHYKS